MAIRWKSGELDELKKQIDRYNRKIARLKKAGTDLGMGSLPERAQLRTAKKFETRAELNAYKKSMERVLKPGSEKLITTKGGIKIPKYERDEMNALNARINARRRKAWTRAEEARRKGDLPLMGRIRDNEAKPRRGLNSVTPAGYKEYKRVAKNEGSIDFTARKAALYRQSYYKMIDRLFTEQDARKIKRRLGQIPDRKLAEKTVDNEEISLSIGSPPAMGSDPIATLIAQGLVKAFPNEFKDVDLYALPPKSLLNPSVNNEPDDELRQRVYDYTGTELDDFLPY